MESEANVSRMQRQLYRHVKLVYNYVQIKPAAFGGEKSELMRSCSEVVSLYCCL